MEIHNLKEIDIFFENCQHTKFDAKGIELISLNEYEYMIGNNKVYSLYMELLTDKKYILIPESTDKCYEVNPIRHLYNYDDVVDIDLYYQDGTKSNIKAYWGGFNVDEINLYQHGKYQVDIDDKLTGKFILEFYIEKLSDDLKSQVEKRKQIRDYIYETLWEYNPLEYSLFNGIRPINVYRNESNDLTNYIYYNKERNLVDFKNYLFNSVNLRWNDRFDKDTFKDNLNKVADIIYKKLLEDEKL